MNRGLSASALSDAGCLRLFPCFNGLQQIRKDRVRNDTVTLGCRMDAVQPVEGWITGHPLKEEGDKDNVVFLRNFGVDGGESRNELYPRDVRR